MPEKRKKILLVEDDNLFSIIEAQILINGGYSVFTSQTGEEAISQVRDKKGDFDLILMDIDLGSGMDGTETARAILKDYDIPVIFLSSHTEKEIIDRTCGIKRYGYILKNTGPTVLFAAIEMAFELYNANKRIKESEDKFRSYIENSPEAILVADNKGKLLEVNRAACLLSGYSEEELLNKTIIELTAPESINDALSHFNRTKETGKATGEGCYIKKDGNRIYLNVNAVKISDSKIIAFYNNISERVKAEEDIKISEEKLRMKLDSLLSPDLNICGQSIEDFIDRKDLKTLMKLFCEITGIGVAILDMEGNILVDAGWQDICTRFHRVHPETLKNCIESDTVLAGVLPEGEFRSYRCKNNMIDVVTPIFIGGRHMANLFLGQFFYEDETPDIAVFAAQAEKYGFLKPEYLEALDRVPRFSREKVKTFMEFYMKMSNQMALLSSNNIKLARMLIEEKEIKNDLTESQNRFNALFKAAKKTALIYSEIENGKLAILEFSPGAEELFGFTKQEVTGNGIFSNNAKICFSWLFESIEGKETHIMKETELLRKSGDGFTGKISGFPVYDNRGNIVAYFALVF